MSDLVRLLSVVAYAELGPNRLGETLVTYAIGYLDAARVLFEHANEGRGLVDLYFYPAAMNLRHGLELFAKQCCDYAAYEQRDSALLYVPGHSLQEAWDRGAATIKSILSFEGPTVDHAELRDAIGFVEGLIADLDALDPTGALFRYPEYVSWSRTGKTRTRGEERRDTHVPFVRVELGRFAEFAATAVCAAQVIDGWLGERASFLRDQRGDPPARLADLVSETVPEEHRELWKRIQGEQEGAQQNEESPRSSDEPRE
jgi:hypothetical protein